MEEILDTVKVDASVLGFKKPVEIVPTIGNVKNALKLNIKVNDTLNFAEKDDFTLYDWFKAQLDVEEATSQYVIDILNLNEKQEERLNNTNADKIYALYLSIVNAILGLDKVIDNGEDSTPSDSGEISK